MRIHEAADVVEDLSFNSRIVAFFLFLYLLATANFYAFWGMPITIYLPAAFLLLFTSSCLTAKFLKVKRDKLCHGLLIFSILLYVMLPFRLLDSFGLGFLTPFFVLYCFLLPEAIFRKSIEYLSFFVAYVSLFAFFVFVFLLVGIDLPYIALEQNFRRNPDDFYYFYFGPVMLSTQFWDVGFGSITRTSGFMAEPGHYAIFCFALLAFWRFDFSKGRNVLILVGGLLTFSPAFYMSFICYCCFRFLKLRYLVGLFLSPFALAAMFFLLPEGLRERLFYRYYNDFESGGVDAIFESRAKTSFNEFYDSLSFDDLIWGVGSEAATYFGFEGAQASDFRGFIISDGMIAIILVAAFYAYILLRSGVTKYAIVCFFFVILVMLHRSSYALQHWFILFLYWGAALNSGARDNSRCRLNERQLA